RSYASKGRTYETARGARTKLCFAGVATALPAHRRSGQIADAAMVSLKATRGTGIASHADPCNASSGGHKERNMTTQRSWLGAVGILALVGVAFPRPAAATPFHFSTGPVTDQMASASRQGSGAGIEIESADDFLLGQET